MKQGALLLLVAGLFSLPLHATNFILNGDFAAGLDHWYGDGITPEQYAHDNSQPTPDALHSKGVTIALRNDAWSKLAQDFQGRFKGGTVTVTYLLAPDCVLSDLPNDYKAIPAKIKYAGWSAFKVKEGRWVLFVADFGTNKGKYWSIKPRVDGKVQTEKFKLTGLTPHEDKTITLAFPPGSGTLILLNISVEAEPDASAADPDAIPKL